MDSLCSTQFPVTEHDKELKFRGVLTVEHYIWNL